jgi:hypothetical protein
MANQPTLTPDALKAIIAEVMQSMAVKMPNPFMDNGKKDQIETLTVRAFKRAGFGEVTPRVDVKTFNKWVAEGLRPKEGEKAIRVKQFRLFHKSQVRPLTKDELAARDAKQPAPASVVPLKPAKGKGKGKGSDQPSPPV